jgi:hypothetical protein
MRRALVLCVFASYLAASPAHVAAAPMLWEYVGVVTGHGGAFGSGPLEHVLPVGSTVAVDILIDPSAPQHPDCFGYYPAATHAVVLRVGGNTYSASSAHTWVNAFGFAGNCGPSTIPMEIVTPGTWFGPSLDGSLPDPAGTYTGFGTPLFSGMTLSWGGPGLPSTQPDFVSLQGPMFSFHDGSPQFFRASLQAVPEPGVLVMLLIGAAGLIRSHRRRT